MSQPIPVQPGTRLGQYTLREPIGQGASATVYLAHDDEARLFAVKVRRRGDTSLDRRFLREFESMRTLRIPGVVRVHEAGLDDEVLWFSMDPVWGRTFVEVVQEEKDMAARVRVALHLGAQLFGILEELHRAGVVHRDVKPSNVLVEKGGAVRVLDFGIVRWFAEHDTMSGAGEVLGTLPFMSPEQVSGLPIGQPIDLFATGIMLWEAVAGERPRPSTPVAWIPRICLESPASLCTLHASVSRSFSALVDDLVAADPGARPTAAVAAARARALLDGADRPVWPRPLWVDPGPWTSRLEGVIGHAGHPPVAVLEGPSGSGRGRIAEQVHRHGVMQGAWPVHVRCSGDVVGGPLEQVLRLLLEHHDERWARDTLGADADTLRQMWPELTVPASTAESRNVSLVEVAGAFARALRRAASDRPLLVVVHRLERVDDLTARALHELAGHVGQRLGVLLLHESRWATPASRGVVDAMRARYPDCYHRLGPLDSATCTQIAASLCPASPPARVSEGRPLDAVLAGLRTLAAWRGEDPPDEDAPLWPLGVRDTPLPSAVFLHAAGRSPPSQWTREDARGVVLDGATARLLAARAVDDLPACARRLADAWEVVLGASAPAAEIAALRLLAREPEAAVAPAIRAALGFEAVGRYGEARRWLFLLAGLPSRVDRVDPDLRFDLELARGRVALRTEAGAPKTVFVERAEHAATTRAHELRARVLAAQYDLRAGNERGALVTALRAASPTSGGGPRVMLEALIVATEARYRLDQLDEIPPQLERAEELLERDPDPLLAVRLANWQAELLLRRHSLDACRALCERTLQHARECGFERGLAFAALRLARVLRLGGRRRAAERNARLAVDTFAVTSDLAMEAEAQVLLATLAAERGDAARAAHLVDRAARRIRSLGLHRLLPAARRVALQIATQQADHSAALLVLGELDGVADVDPEAPAARVRWLRSRGDTSQALAVEGPSADGYGRVLWLVERCRAHLVAAQRDAAVQAANDAKLAARRLGYDELQLYALLLLDLLQPSDEERWSSLLRAASKSLYTELYLGALEMDARRLSSRSDVEGANARWRTLRARAEEIGYRPGVEEAVGWLAASPT